MAESPESVTSICNMALGALGAQRINDFESDDSTEAIQCQLHYTQTRDALMRSHEWRFASDRATLSQDSTDPDFEWDNQFILPQDFMRFKSFFADNGSVDQTVVFSFAIEGQRLLTNENTVEIRYIKKVIDPTKFDPLFVEALVAQLSVKMVMPLAQDRLLRRELLDTLREVMARVRLVDKAEQNTLNKTISWNQSRRTRGGRSDIRSGIL